MCICFVCVCVCVCVFVCVVAASLSLLAVIPWALIPALGMRVSNIPHLLCTLTPTLKTTYSTTLDPPTTSDLAFYLLQDECRGRYLVG